MSDVFTIRTSQVPDTMESILTLSALSTFVISWQEPDNGGETID